MFRCEMCGELSKPGEPSESLVTLVRKHVFPFRAKAHTFRDHGKIETRDDPGGTGSQIVKEIRVHRYCMPKEKP